MFGKESRILYVAVFGLFFGFLTMAAPAFAASQEKVLYSFCSAQLCPDGSNPTASLIPDATGNLYGTAVYGGNSNCPHGCGTVFELTVGANGKWKQKVLHHFEENGRDGYYPEGSLIFDKAGKLYGTTSAGGPYSGGTVFELMPGNNGKWSERILYSFDWGKGDGCGPIAALTFDASGNLYGTASLCGANDDGTVFKLTRGANGHWSEKVLYDFNWNNGKDGCYPAAVLVFDSSGNLYGATGAGGPYGNGTIFELTPGKHGSWTEKVLYFFGGGSDGSVPDGHLVFDAAGSLYGTTTFAGGIQACNDGGCGTVFKFAPGAKGNWTLTTLYSFDETDGAFPAGVIFDAAGNLYGTTQGGGVYSSDCPSDGMYGCGAVFKLTPGGGKWTEKVLHSFDNNGVDGWEPYGGLIMDAAENLYGTTYSGGAYSYGTVFEVTP